MRLPEDSWLLVFWEERRLLAALLAQLAGLAGVIYAVMSALWR